MRKGLTEIVFILDRSGSMSGLEADTIGGFNSMIEKQQKEEGEAYISTVLFDDQTEVLVGGAIHHIGNVHKYARPEDVPEKTLFIITTDGMENASRRYDYRKVKKMVEHQKEKYNWEFIFLGANIDAIEVAGRFGVSASRAVRYECDSEGTALNFNVMSNIITGARKCGSAKAMSDMLEESNALEDIQKDYKRRHRA